MNDLINIILSMTDDECKTWLGNKKNKQLLKDFWIYTYPEVCLPKNMGEILYIIKYNENPICQYGNHKKFKQFPKGYYTSCHKNQTKECTCLNILRSDHSNHKKYDKNAAVEARKQTMLNKYGVDNAFKMADHACKTKKTFIEKYGQPTARGLAIIQDKIKQTSLEKYGVDHYTKSEEYKEKSSSTNLQKYNNIHAIASDIVKEKINKTMMERYGVDNYFKSEDHQVDIIQNRLDTHGYTNPGQRFLSPETYNILQDVELFKSYIDGVSFEAAAIALNTSAYTIASYIRKYNLLEYARPGTGSVIQDEIETWLVDLGITVIRNSRSIIPPKEIDLYLPEYKLGIEYNGIYHHTELSGGKDKNYHRNKYLACQQNGITLIQICSTVYKSHKNLIKNMILAKLGRNTKIGARKCKLNEVPYNDATEFLKNNHIQNCTTVGKYRYGLYFNDELVQLMTFGNIRKPMGSSSTPDAYELIRMASKQGITITGGFSKLFLHFVNSMSPHRVISYSDLRYFSGESLKTSGFIKIGESDPGYWYTDYKKVYHRYNFAKYKLIKQGHDPMLTEFQIMEQLGYDKLWDCGQAKWEWISD